MAQFAFLAGAAISAYGKAKSGDAAKASAKLEAAQMQAAANSEAATSQRAAIEDLRQARYARSRAIAVAAASGAGGDSVQTTVANIDAEGAYHSMVSLYEGDTRAQSLRFGAKIRRKEGSAAQSAAYLSAGSSLLSAAGSFYGKYGSGGEMDQLQPVKTTVQPMLEYQTPTVRRI